MSSSPRLSIEVIEHMIDELGAAQETAALARCIRVHKDWIPRTRIHLWRTLTVYSSKQLPIICATFDRNPILQSLVEVVRLKPDRGRSVESGSAQGRHPFPLTASIVLLPYLIHIQAWEFLGHGHTPFPLQRATLVSLRQYRDVKRVVLSGVYFKNLFHFYPLQNAFPALEEIIIEDVAVDDPPSYQSLMSEHGRRKGLRRLQCFEVTSAIEFTSLESS
ncbi:uncharacterized protein BXZ73DRAFT_75934 [Epithele typhae]|uniref:uncharacterized protein n=1 Tax=Epithele typhae TaxID=378194 RepID=UPI0020086982|nr:uncharacterized protein BXZ73DRAFT_75934 [Epithele typhae]KAH9939762.1 hypothetical protein BXZ73DRAFT_75934 [Epithele typhae]